MSNKFRQVRQQQPPPKPRAEEPQGDMLGFQGEKSPQILPLTSAATAQHIRVKKGELTKDVGWTQLGVPVGLIIGLIEHKWQFGGQLYARVLRIFNEGGVTRSQYWDGVQWVESAQATEPMRDVYLSEVSIQGCLVLADGQRIMKWCEEIETTMYGHDFLPGILLGEGGTTGECSDDVTIDPALAVDNEYRIYFSILWTDLPSTEEASVQILIFHNDFQFTTRIYRRVAGQQWGDPIAYLDDNLEVNPDYPEAGDLAGTNIEYVARVRRAIEPGDTLRICLGEETVVTVDEIRMDLFDRSTIFPAEPPAIPDPIKLWNYMVQKWFVFGWDRTLTYDFHFTTKIPAGETLGVTLYAIYVDSNGAILTLFSESKVYVNSSGVEEITERVEPVSVTNTPPVVTFSLFYEAILSSAGIQDMPFDDGPITGQKYIEIVGPFTSGTQVNPYNKLIDGDPHYGVEYDVATGSEVVFEPLSDDAPAARYIFGFGDRLIALQDFGDRQVLAASADGDITVWKGFEAPFNTDTLYTSLLDAQIDPIDDLMCGAHIGGGNFALYRKRSIWRGFETGNVDLPIGVVPWLAGIGTEFRFSLQIVPGGNIFLGNDSMVYILSEGGQLTAVGGPIRDWIVKHLTAEDILVDYDLVDSLFDSWLQEYWLAVPKDGNSMVDTIWIFDLGLFYREQKIVWRERPMPNGVRRLAAVTMLPEPL